MPRPASTPPAAPLAERLSARRPELEQAAMARIEAISDPSAAPDPAYLHGLRGALAAALDYGLTAISSPAREPEPVPLQLLSQARLAARNGVSLDAVVRRYAAGHSLLADGLLEEAAGLGIAAAQLKDSLRALGACYERILAAVSEEYASEAESGPRGPEGRRYVLVCRLLAGESLDASPLGYELDAHHLALVASGPAAGEGLEQLGAGLDRRLLLIVPQEQSAWAWLGGRRPFDTDELDRIAAFAWPEGVALACGTPNQGLFGWHLGHRQAAAALPVAQGAAETLVHYDDVALLAAVLSDNLLAASLRQAYLAPLERERDAGTAKDTLRAYFAAARNTSSAAAALGVNRRTVASRLAAVEERLGRSLDAVASELDLALRLDELETSPTHRNSGE